jgi:MFS superfamily sulfate permease-like transporter
MLSNVKKMFADSTRESVTSDIVSGLMVFLIALPLSVGIALASGAPPSAGLWAAIFGGILGSVTGGSYLTINGPAAGLIVVVLGAIQDLGAGDSQAGFRRALAAFVVAGVIQIIFGKLKLGRLGLAIPGSVIHGMLSAIGVIIVTKQLFVALGIAASGKNTLAMMAELPS